jgi:hypothetical protein
VRTALIGYCIGVQSQKYIYLVWHARDRADGIASLVGVFSSEELAESRIQRVRELPGFADEQNDFWVSQCSLDGYGWSLTLEPA